MRLRFSATRTLGLAATLALTVPSTEAAAQILSLGGRLSVAGGDESTFGVGVQATVGVPLVGLRAQGTADLFFPDCGASDCDLRDLGLNLLFSPPIPLLDPYLGAGLAILDKEDETLGDDRDLALNLLAGVGFRRLFVEAKLQLSEGLDGHVVITGGVNVPIL